MSEGWPSDLLRADLPRVVLVETAPGLPGLLPWAAWEALRAAETVWARDADSHPAAPYLALADVALQTLPPAEVGLADMSLMAPGSPADRRMAKAIMQRATGGEDVTFLLDPGDEGLTQAVGMAATEHGAEVEFVFLTPRPRGAEVLRLADVMASLRDPDDGCPWDLEQDHQTLVPYLLEETHELVEAIEAGDDRHLAEELGDVLLQVAFHAQVATDRRAFDLDDVARGITDKLIRRHPHVFADGDASTPDEVQANWDKLKAAEKVDRTGPFDGIPTALPALQAAAKHQKRAAKLGFDWPDADGVVAKIHEELDEVLAASSAQERAAELGDLLAAVVALARHLDVEPEAAMRAATRTFRDRVEAMARRATARGLDLDQLDLDGWRDLWAEVKDVDG